MSQRMRHLYLKQFLDFGPFAASHHGGCALSSSINSQDRRFIKRRDKKGAGRVAKMMFYKVDFMIFRLAKSGRQLLPNTLHLPQPFERGQVIPSGRSLEQVEALREKTQDMH